ncbi:MAG: MFS transporter [Candidatus Cryptobacteroides sp.]
MKPIKTNPWLWVPTLYFAEGIPYFIVNNISVIMFTRMGMPKGQMAVLTGLLYLPWVIKPLWSPFVDILRTKRWWVLAMQAVMTVAFACVAFSLPGQYGALSGETSVSSTLFIPALVLFFLTAFASATHDIAADGFYMLALDNREQSLFVGIRSTFYRLSSIFGQGVLVVVAGLLETRLDNIPRAWSLTILICSAIFALLTLSHLFTLPKPSSDTLRPNVSEGVKSIFIEFGRTFVTFFKKPHIFSAMLFMLLYRLPEALSVKMLNPFLLDPVSEGGLGLSTEAVGVVYGTAGVIALTVGGIIGGAAASRYGLFKMMWPMAASLALPCSVYLYMALAQPSNIWLIGTCIAIDQFGYGFGFTAYMLYMMHFSKGNFATSHYSLCTAFMALSMMLPGMAAGYIFEALGYVAFFILVMICCLATAAVTARLHYIENKQVNL